MSVEVGHRKEGRRPGSYMVSPNGTPEKILVQIQMSMLASSLSVEIMEPTSHLLPLKASKVEEK